MRYQVSKQIEFCFGHRLLNYSGKCKHLHGHNAIVEITLSADKLDACGMVWDFVEIKNTLKNWIDAEMDHRLILCEQDPYLPKLKELGEPVFVMAQNPTMENIAQLLLDKAKILGLPATAIKIWESSSSHVYLSEVTQ